MTLTDKQVAGLTLRMLAATPKMEDARKCAIEGLHALAERDLEWINFLKEKHGIDVDYSKLSSLYKQAEMTIRNY